MYRPPKKPEENAPSINRQRYPGEDKVPTLQRCREMLEDAKSRRGCSFELPWTIDGGGDFTLSVAWDATGDPLWTLYEGGSKVAWSQAFAPTELEFMFDILQMSAAQAQGPNAKAVAIPDQLKPGANKKEPGAAMNPGAAPPGAAPGFGTAPAMSPPGFGAPMAPMMPQTPPIQPTPSPHPPLHPGQSFPPQPGFGAPPGYPPPYPPQMPPQMPPGYPPPPQPMPPGYPQPGMQMPPPGYPPPQPMPMPTYTQQPSVHTADDPRMPVDYHLLDKRANILLGTLLKEAGLINEPTLEAALKLQELVREEKMTPEQAPDALKRLHTLGANIEQYLAPSDTTPSYTPPGGTHPVTPKGNPAAMAKPTPQPTGAAGAASPSAGSAAAGGAKPKPVRDLKGAFDLLIKAGILTESDITTAQNVRNKHGGDVVQILQAASKVDTKTVDAAVTCLPLIREGLMKQEQCIIALNYCSRMRVGFDDALEEMGWQNPRKLRSDLPL